MNATNPATVYLLAEALTPIGRPSVDVVTDPRGIALTVADLLTLLEGVDPATRIDWEVEHPNPCCGDHFHDITRTSGHLAHVDARNHLVAIVLSDGSA